MEKFVVKVWFDKPLFGTRKTFISDALKTGSVYGVSLWDTGKVNDFASALMNDRDGMRFTYACMWNIDGLITTADECSIFFGPFNSVEDAKSNVQFLDSRSEMQIIGFKIYADRLVPESEKKTVVYSDG